MVARTTIILLGAAFLFFQMPAFAADDLNFTRVCEVLLKREGVGIFISRDGYDVITGRHKLFATDTSQAAHLKFKDLMARIPFGRLLQADAPALSKLDWQRSADSVTAIFRLQEGHSVAVIVDFRGMIEVRIGGSELRARDMQIYEEVIQRFQQNGGEALLFAQHGVLPSSADDGFEFYITRLDAKNQSTRRALNAVLTYLLAS